MRKLNYRPNHCGRHLGKINSHKSTNKSMVMHFLTNYYVLNGKTLGKNCLNVKLWYLAG